MSGRCSFWAAKIFSACSPSLFDCAIPAEFFRRAVTPASQQISTSTVDQQSERDLESLLAALIYRPVSGVAAGGNLRVLCVLPALLLLLLLKVLEFTAKSLQHAAKVGQRNRRERRPVSVHQSKTGRS